MLIKALHAVLLLEFEVLLPEGVDAVNHALHELHLGVAETVLVRDVVGVASLAAGLSPGAPGLHLELLAPLLEGAHAAVALLGPAGQVNVHGGTHAGAQVGGAGVDVAELGGDLEVLAGLGLHRVTDGLDAAGQALEHTLDVTALLHGDDPELVLLVDPHEEGLLGVVEDAAALGPVALHAGHLQVGVARHEEEVVVHKLLAHLLVHAGEVTGELLAGTLEEGLDAYALLLGDAGGETESLDAAANADADRVDRDLWVDVAGDLGGVHVGDVLEVGGEAVVLRDEGVEHVGKVDVAVLIAGVDSAVLVVELDSAGDGLG